MPPWPVAPTLSPVRARPAHVDAYVSVDTISVGRSTRARSDALAHAATTLDPDQFAMAQKRGAVMTGDEAFDLATSELDALAD